MHRQAYAYAQPVPAPTAHRYSGTSSAFSPSANPNEDWTKISDLAERRRIQNRIAQRNYRKKLKKRLEDLERRAASNSASPEQRPAELDRSSSQSRERDEGHGIEGDGATSPSSVSSRGHSHGHSQYLPPSQSHSYGDERQQLFAQHNQQYPRHVSVSPPPFSYSTYPAPDIVAYSPYQPPALPAYSPYSLPPLGSPYHASLPSLVHPVKHDFYGEDEISPFSMNYATMAGLDIPPAHSYHHDSHPQTPPLSETSFEASVASSPPDSLSAFPTTPASMPSTPPRLQFI